MDYLKRCTQSPDFNMIENLCVDRKRTVHARWPKNMAELDAFCKEEWEKIPNTKIERLLAGYKKHLQAVTSARGVVTNY